MAFAAGALVFPGGRIDEADRELAGATWHRRSGAGGHPRDHRGDRGSGRPVAGSGRRNRPRASARAGRSSGRFARAARATQALRSTPARSPRSPAGCRSSTRCAGSTLCSSSPHARRANGSRASSKTNARARHGSRAAEILEREQRGRSAADLPDPPDTRAARATFDASRKSEPMRWLIRSSRSLRGSKSAMVRNSSRSRPI